MFSVFVRMYSVIDIRSDFTIFVTTLHGHFCLNVHHGHGHYSSVHCSLDLRSQICVLWWLLCSAAPWASRPRGVDTNWGLAWPDGPLHSAMHYEKLTGQYISIWAPNTRILPSFLWSTCIKKPGAIWNARMKNLLLGFYCALHRPLALKWASQGQDQMQNTVI